MVEVDDALRCGFCAACGRLFPLERPCAAC